MPAIDYEIATVMKVTITDNALHLDTVARCLFDYEQDQWESKLAKARKPLHRETVSYDLNTYEITCKDARFKKGLNARFLKNPELIDMLLAGSVGAFTFKLK